MKYGLTETTVENICAVFARFPEIEKAVLYGSRAKGNFKTGSDIDLTLCGDELTSDLCSTIASALDDLLLPYTIDLSVFNELNHAELREHIERVGMVFYKRANQCAGMKKNWEVKRMGEVCLIKPPKSEARKQLGSSDLVSFVPMENLGIGSKYLVARQVRPLEDVVGSYTYFAEEDVLLAKITPCFENGKLGIARNLSNGVGFGSSEYIVFRTNKSLHNEFLYYFLSREQFREEGAQRMSGAVGHKRVAKDFIENYPIPLPPLPEQQRIVAILDEAFAAIATAKENAAKNLQNARELFESYLQSVFANPGDGWEEKAFDKVCVFQRGFDLPTHSRNAGSFPLVSSNGITDWIDVWKVNAPGVVTGRSGTIGNIHYVEKDFWPLNTALYIKDFHGNDPRFVYYFLKQFDLGKYSSGAGVPTLNRNNVHVVQVNFPKSIPEQRAIVAKLDALAAETKKLEALYRQKLNDLDELKKSVLKKAFDGKL